MQGLPAATRARLLSLLPGEQRGDDATGATLARRFLLEHVVAKGGFSTVYFGRDLQGKGEPVAVKIIHETKGKAEWLRRKWEAEQATLAKLNHPGVIRPRFAALDDNHGMFIATDYIEGVTLRACLRQVRTRTRAFDCGRSLQRPSIRARYGSGSLRFKAGQHYAEESRAAERIRHAHRFWYCHSA
jgi:serine/threonine protein kinase